MLKATVNRMLEFSFETSKPYGGSPGGVTLDVVFAGPGRELRVPAFDAGGGEWRVRFCASAPGRWSWRTECSDRANADLHGRSGEEP